MNLWSDLILAFITMTLMFYLALAFIGKKSGWNAIITITILALQGVYFRDIYFLNLPTYILVYSVIFTLSLFLIQRINFILSLFGAILTIITSIFGNIFLLYPLFASVGFKTPGSRGWQWLVGCLTELILPFIVFLVLKISKISITRFMPEKEN